MKITCISVDGSWLNMVELEIFILTGQELSRSFANFDQVRQVIERWKKTKGERAEPVNWQFKTAYTCIRLGCTDN